jgi:O-antigen ligase
MTSALLRASAPAAPRMLLSTAGAGVLMGLGAWLFVPVGGRLSLLEAAALVLAPPTLVVFGRERWGRLVLAGAAAWFVGVLTSAVLHPAALRLVVVQVAAVIAVPVAAALIWYLLRAGDARTRSALVAAFGAGQILGLLVTPPAAASLGIWKFGLGQGVTLLVMVLLDRFGRGRVGPVMLVLIAGLHLALGARGLALFTLVVLVATTVLPSREGSGIRLVPARVVVTMVAAVVAGLALQSAYVDLATSGRLGPGEQLKVSFQTGDYGLLVGGRKDFVFLVSAIGHSPLTGWGSSGTVPPDVKGGAIEFLQEHGYSVIGYDYLVLVLPDNLFLHSEFLDAWVTAGILAVPFWLVALVLIWRGMVDAFARRSLAESFVLAVALWHLFFSPLGDTSRGHLALALALGLTTVARRRSAHGIRSEPSQPVGQ